MNTKRVILPLIILSLISCFMSPLQAKTITSIAPMLKTAMPSIVAISGTKRIKAYPVPIIPGQQDFALPNNPQDLEEHVAKMIGSGVVVSRANGYILTNSHVVADLEEIQVQLSNNSRYQAKLIGHDAASDLALIQIDARNLVEVKFADSDTVEVGDFVVAIGSPYGFNQTVTSGIVSAIGRNDVGLEGYYDFIQTDADINMGNSGGGLFNMQGQLIGINTMIVSAENGAGSIGIGFAIPANMARGIMAQLAAHGHVDRGPLGVRAQPLTPELAKAFKIKSTVGAIVNDVVPRTPAAIAGIEAGDIILQVDDKKVKDSFHLRTLISLIPPGNKAKLQIYRNSKIINVTMLMTDAHSQYTQGETIYSGLNGGYLMATESDSPVRGVRIAEMKLNSPITRSDLLVDDIIIAVGTDKTEVPSIEALKAAIDAKQDVIVLRIMREQYTFFIAVSQANN